MGTAGACLSVGCVSLLASACAGEPSMCDGLENAVFLGETRFYDDEWRLSPWNTSALGKALTAMGDGDAVLLCPGTYQGLFYLTCDDVASRRVIQGSGQDVTFVTGDASVRWNALDIYNCATTMRDLTVRDGLRDDPYDCSEDNSCGGANGGGISVSGYPEPASLLLERVALTGNQAQHGGGLYAWDDDITITAGEVSGNRAGRGAGIGLRSGTLTVEDTRFGDNRSYDVSLFDDDGEDVGDFVFDGRHSFACEGAVCE